MVHRIFGWIGGYVKVRIQGKNVERFVNLCRNRGIILWQMYWEPEQDRMYFRISLRDFYRLRPLARKCRVRPIVVKRFGLPFFIELMKRRASLCLGMVLCFALVLFLSSRIWGIAVEGQSYHTEESILEYLDSIDVYGGMDAASLECSRLEEQIRRKFNDIGWVSVEKKGSKIFIRIKEILLVEGEKREKKGHLVAAEKGEVVSIVTRNGTAKVKAGDKVRKGKTLISGLVKIFGDNQELVGKEYVRAEGTVVLSVREKYGDSLAKTGEKTVYTGRIRKVHELQLGGEKFFFYNPLNNLETYKKYDIIRDGGRLCPQLSLRFPVCYFVKTFREFVREEKTYSEQEAEEILQKRFAYYLQQKEEAGYLLQEQDVSLVDCGEEYQYRGTLVFLKKQESYRYYERRSAEVKEKSKEKSNGNNGDGN